MMFKEIPMSTVLQQLTALLGKRFGVTDSEVNADSTFAELDLDSLALVEITLAAEKEFHVSIREDEVSPEDTVRKMVELIAAKKVAA
jgi:acyl carrier protein